MSQHDQFDFTDLFEEMEAAERTKLDEHRSKVQAWFDALSVEQKHQLGEWMHGPEWQTCQALSAAACNWYQVHFDRNASVQRVARGY